MSEIITNRLILKPVTTVDLDIYTDLLTSVEITKYLPPGGQPFSKEYIANYLPKKIEHWDKGYGTFIICLRDNSNIKIGYAGVETIVENGLNDIRYALLPKFQNRGYALEAAQSALAFTFANTKLSEIYGVAVAENFPWVRVLEKLGMTSTSVRLYDNDDLITMSVNCAGCTHI